MKTEQSASEADCVKVQRQPAARGQEHHPPRWKRADEQLQGLHDLRGGVDEMEIVDRQDGGTPRLGGDGVDQRGGHVEGCLVRLAQERPSRRCRPVGELSTGRSSPAIRYLRKRSRISIAVIDRVVHRAHMQGREKVHDEGGLAVAGSGDHGDDPAFAQPLDPGQ